MIDVDAVAMRVISPIGTRFIATVAGKEAQSNLPAKNMGCLRPPLDGNAVNDFHHNSRLATIIGAFKAGVTREIGTILPGRDQSLTFCVWQSRFHDHVVRNQSSFDIIANYIENNVERWATDCFNSSCK